MIRDAKLDLQALRFASEAARERVQQWPAWEQEIVRAVSTAASSSSSRKALGTVVDVDAPTQQPENGS